MRCPKCGYISFDHLAECRKCHKDLEAISSALTGTAYNVQPPTFLNLHRHEMDDEIEEMELAEEPVFGDDEEYVDDELAVLVEDEDAEPEGDINFAVEDDQTDPGPAAGTEQEEREIEIDFSKFEAADKPATGPFDEEDPDETEEDDELEEFALKIDMPEELADISDLAPPKRESKTQAPPLEEPADEELPELSLDDLNFDLGLDDLDNKTPTDPKVHEEAMLALDEIDFSDSPAASSPEGKKESGNADMDLDLDFELDLGGLSIHKDV